MTTLTLTVLRCPDYGSAEQRQIQGGELTIGRGSECDWALPDPARSLSRKHCNVEYIGGAWQVRDMSSNGTFVNAATTPIGRDQMQPLRSGDRLRLGDYEIEARIEEARLETTRPSVHVRDADVLPFGQAAPAAFGGVRLPGLDAPGSLPGLGTSSPFGHGAVADHAPMSANAYAPPGAVQAPPRDVPAAGKVLVPDDWLDMPAPSAPSAPAAVAPLPKAEPPPPATAPAPVSPAGGDMTAALFALLAGGELTPDLVARAAADPDTALRNAGALLHAAVAGIRALLISRGAIKREFRIEQTVLRTRENNPLKFAPSDEQALAMLLDPRSNGLEAVRDSINDLTSHQVAVLAATQAAARALLEQLEPSKLEAADTGGGLLPGTLEKRLWTAYKRRHARLLEQFEDDFESAFGKAFARAYEQAVGRGND